MSNGGERRAVHVSRWWVSGSPSCHGRTKAKAWELVSELDDLDSCVVELVKELVMEGGGIMEVEIYLRENYG